MGRLCLVALGALALAQTSSAATMASAHYRIVGANTNGGSGLSGSVGQSEALGFSGSVLTLRTLAPGFWPLVGGFPHLDSDADLIQAYRDNCPFAYNPTQSDLGGVLSLAPDGVGDACQCGDVNDDAVVDELDSSAYRAGRRRDRARARARSVPARHRTDVRGRYGAVASRSPASCSRLRTSRRSRGTCGRSWTATRSSSRSRPRAKSRCGCSGSTLPRATSRTAIAHARRSRVSWPAAKSP